MDREHWFDALNKALVGAAPRRALLGAAAAAIADLAFADRYGVDAAKNRNKKKGKKKKGKGRLRRCGPDVYTACETIFDTPEGVQFCKDKCESCRAAGIDFCIHEPDDEHPANHATCCSRGEACCGYGGISECCAAEECCELEGIRQCLEPGSVCCPSDPSGFCELGFTCCPPGGCFQCEPPFVVTCDDDGCVCPDVCEAPLVQNPDTCACECPDGAECPREGCGETCVGLWLKCCDGFCQATRNSLHHCGGCNRPCSEAGKRCCDGDCVDVRFNNDRCGSTCKPCPAGHACCHGACIDTRIWACCRDHPTWAHSCPIATTRCCTRSDGQHDCCFL